MGTRVTPPRALAPVVDGIQDWKPVFISALRDTANVRAACQVANISRKTAYKTRKNNKTFAKDWDEAIEEACDILEAVARNRACSNSDTLLIFLLKAHRPEKYRELTRHEVTGKDGDRLTFTLELGELNGGDNQN